MGSNQDHSFYMPSVVPVGIYLTPASSLAMFPVSAGAHTVYLNANRSGTTVSYIWDVQVNVLFVPTTYGSATFAGGADDGQQFQNPQVARALSADDLAAERQESIRANEDRISEELAALRAQVDALTAEVNIQRERQQAGSR